MGKGGFEFDFRFGSRKFGRLIEERAIEDYVLFDCPGQVELFTHHESLRNIFFRIQKFGYRVRHSLTPCRLPLAVMFC